MLGLCRLQSCCCHGVVLVGLAHWAHTRVGSAGGAVASVHAEYLSHLQPSTVRISVGVTGPPQGLCHVKVCLAIDERYAVV